MSYIDSRRRTDEHRRCVSMPSGRVPGSLDPTVWFWPFVDISSPDACWLWTRTQSPRGYGHVYDRRIKKYRGAHRVALSLHLGVAVADLIQANHTCDVRLCCNPSHLYNGTQKQNQQDMSSRGRSAMQKKTHCVHGHPLVGDNLRMNTRGERVCLTCDHETQKRSRQRRLERTVVSDVA